MKHFTLLCRSTLLGLLLAVLLSVHAIADITVPNAFTAGQPAKASEVNENFITVKDGVNANAADMLALQATVAELQAQLSLLQFKFDARNPSNSLHGLIAGHSYNVYYTSSGFLGGNGTQMFKDYIRFILAGGNGILSFNADGTLTDTGTSEGLEGNTTPYLCSLRDEGGNCIGYYYLPLQQNTDSWADETATWVVDEATGKVTITWSDGEIDTFLASPDGTIMSYNGWDDEVDGGSRRVKTSQAMLARLPNQTPVLLNQDIDCASVGTVCSLLQYDDADGDTVFRFAITGGADAQSYSIDVNSGEITRIVSSCGSDTILVEMTDGKLNGTSEEATIVIDRGQGCAPAP